MSNTHNIIQLRRGTAVEWAASEPQPGGEVLKLGEPGYEKDTKKLKIGDGVTPWNTLPYITPDFINIVSSGAISDLTVNQQNQIVEGAIVLTTDGVRWVYSGTGSKILEASYVQLADISPAWIQITSKPASLVGLADILSSASGDFILATGNNTYQVTNFAESMDDRIGQLVVSGTGININYNDNLNTLTVSTTGVSFDGHTHTSSNITDFNSSVSVLLPTISNSGDNRVLTSTGTSTGINAENNLTFDGTTLSVSGAIAVDNITIDGNSIISTNADGNLIIAPTGTGALQASSGGNARGSNAVDCQTIRASGTQVASGAYSVISGGQNNTASNTWNTVSGGYSNTANGSLYATVGGGNMNTASGYGGTISGGSGNTSSGSYSTIAGGERNTASGIRSTIAGGTWNTSSGNYSTIAGGTSNTASSGSAIVGGGLQNTASGQYSTIAGGKLNTASGYGSFVGGGGPWGGPQGNTSSGFYSTVAGGLTNTASAHYGTVSGGTRALADRYAMNSYAAGRFSANGDAQNALFVLRCKTTTNSGVEMALDGSTTYLTVPSGKVISGTINIIGTKSDGASVARYLRQFTIKNVGGTTSLVGSVITLGTDEATGTSISITANNTNDYLSIIVTGVTSEIWRWVASVNAVEVAYGT